MRRSRDARSPSRRQDASAATAAAGSRSDSSAQRGRALGLERVFFEFNFLSSLSAIVVAKRHWRKRTERGPGGAALPGRARGAARPGPAAGRRGRP